MRIYSDQELRELLEAALDRELPEVDRRNAAFMLCADLKAALEGAPGDGEEPDRAAEYERSRRAALEGAEEVRPNEQ